MSLRVVLSSPIKTMSLTTAPSICIPRTLHNVGWRDVKDTFEQLCGKGTVERVDIVKKRDDSSPFCKIFIHMRYWPTDQPEVEAIRQRLLDGETVKVVYDNPWFWKCSASHAPKPERTRPKAAPYVEFAEKTESQSPPWVRRQARQRAAKDDETVNQLDTDIANNKEKLEQHNQDCIDQVAVEE